MSLETTPCLVCATSTFPTFDSIYNQIKDLNLAFNPKFPDIPSLPTMPSLPSMPSPMFPNMTMPDFEKSNLSFSLIVNQVFKWFEAIFAKLSSFMGIANFSFPEIPNLGLKLPDIVNPSFDLSSYIANMKLSMPTLNFSIPMLPDPLLPNMNMPEFEYSAKIQTLIADYCSALMTSLTSLVQSVTDKLNAKPFNAGLTMPTLPTIPTDFNAMMASIYASLGVPDLESMIAKYKMPDLTMPNVTMPEVPSLSSLFSSIKLPGFDLMNVSLPDPLLGDIKNPQLEIMELSKNYYMALVSVVGKKIDDFVQTMTGWIGAFTPPQVCVSVPTYA